MRVLVASEARFRRDSEGAVWAEGPEDYAFWSAYREVFDEVVVLARVGAGGSSAGTARADGQGVRFRPLHDYRGPWQYLGGRERLRRQARRAVADADAFVLRAPGAVAYLAWDEIRRQRRRAAVEVLADPWEALAPGGVASWSRPLARRWSRRCLRRLCGEAPLLCYVTRRWLQQRYPSNGARVFSCSDVRLGALAGESEMSDRAGRIRAAAAGERPWELGFLGSLEQLYKAPDVLLRAAATCRRRGINLRLTLAGGGRFRPTLERLARDLRLDAAVRFLGPLPPGAPIAAFLDSLDLFVLPSRCEGLPRALLEAMSRGCPAIASSAGGIPELLPAGDLVEPGDAGLLAAKIAQTLADCARLEAMARRNRAASEPFRRDRLDRERRRFLDEVRREALLAAGRFHGGPP